MEIIIEHKNVARKITGGFKLHGTKKDIMLLNSSIKEQIDQFKADEIGTINVNVKPEELTAIQPWSS